MKLFLFIIILNLSSLNYSYGQNRKIKEIELTSNILKNQITSFIKDKKNNNSKFKELGYVVVNLDYYNNRAKKPELSLIYTIKDQYVSLEENSQFPLFYTYIENKIVLLYIYNYHNYINLSTKSKKRLSNKINKTLGKREKIRAYNSEGEKIIDDKYFYPNESFNIHGGIELKIFANDSISVKPKAQEKKTVYLIFKENEQVNCVKYNSNNNRQDRSTSTYTGVMKKSENSNKEIVFSMCREKLFLIKDTNPEKISTTDVNELDLVKFDYLIEEYIKLDMFSKRYVFDKIYFIEKINEKEYLKYEVYWEHYVHRGIQN